jgi:two-component system sensor histidine kinase CreC
MKMSYGLRAFVIYFVILGTLICFTLDNAIERLNDGMRQSAESVIVNIAHVLAAFIEDEAAWDDTTSAPTRGSRAINSDQLQRVFTGVKSRVLDAQIYQVSKKKIDSEVTIADHNGIVIYDSTGKHLGKDYSRWRDVNTAPGPAPWTNNIPSQAIQRLWWLQRPLQNKEISLVWSVFSSQSMV